MQTSTPTPRSLRGLPLLLGLATLGIIQPRAQAQVAFTETLMDTSAGATGAEIQNDGAPIRAYRIGETGTITVNGLTFQGAAGAGNDSALSGTWGGSGYLDWWINNPPIITNTDYLHLTGCLLQAPADTAGTKPALTISGLTPGNTYRLQLFSNSPRGGEAEVEGNTYTMQTGDHKFVMLTAMWPAADDTLNMRWIAQTNADPVHFSAYALHDITGAGSGTTYANWAGSSGYNLTGGANDDDDNDGVSNHDEYAFGLNPTTGTSINPITDISELSRLGKFTYTRTADPSPALAYTVWVSTDLADWGVAPVAATQVPRSPVLDGVETVDVTLDGYAPPSGGKLFVRVQAE